MNHKTCWNGKTVCISCLIYKPTHKVIDMRKGSALKPCSHDQAKKVIMSNVI